jgi:phosphoserine phosphatase RsbU/P
MDTDNRILIAEDDLTSRTLLERLLCSWGYRVTVSSDGEEALALLQRSDAPRLAVLDWMMPGLDGPELCRRLRAEDPVEPRYIILLTCRGDRQDVVNGLDAGADDYIPKPYHGEELRARVNVGRRVLDLQLKLKEREKLQGVLEMAGAVCHELNQPLQVLSGWSELLLLKRGESSLNEQALRNIQDGVRRIGELTRKIMSVSHYRTKPYVGDGNRIVDIDRSSPQLG